MDVQSTCGGRYIHDPYPKLASNKGSSLVPDAKSYRHGHGSRLHPPYATLNAPSNLLRSSESASNCNSTSRARGKGGTGEGRGIIFEKGRIHHRMERSNKNIQLMRNIDDGRGRGFEEQGGGMEDIEKKGPPRPVELSVTCSHLSEYIGPNVPESDHAWCASSQISLRQAQTLIRGCLSGSVTEGDQVPEKGGGKGRGRRC